MMMKYQVVSYQQWIGVHFWRPGYSSLRLIFDWFLDLGWWQIRKWRHPPVNQEEIDKFYDERETVKE